MALADFRKAEGLGEPIFVSYELAVLLHRMGKLDPARTYLDTFLERFPDYPSALEERAHVLAALGESEAAVADFEKLFAAQLRPNPGSYVSGAELLAAQGETGVEAGQRFDEALAQLETLRKTVARQRVLEKLQKLHASMSDRS